MSTYSYADCLKNSYRVNWKISDVIGERHFDTARSWLPSRLSGAARVTSLTPDEKMTLNHVEMGAYAHLFGFVEEFIAPRMVGLARDFALDDREAFDALTNFAAEEVKHMNLFKQIRDRIDGKMGFPLELLGGQQETARFVLSKSRGAVLLLTACIEWFTQRHYLECFEGAEDLLRAREAMTLAGVLDLADQSVDALAGGERQRALLARALAQEPRTLLLDEPTSHLDLRHQRHLIGLLRRLNRERGMTVVFVTHDLNLAGELADRLLLLSGGRVIRLGTPAEVLDETVLERAYGCPVWVERLGAGGRPVVLGARL